MGKKSKSHSGKKKKTNIQFKKGPSLVTEDPSLQPPKENSLPVLPMKTHLSNIQSETPSTSNGINLINLDEMVEISERIKLIVNKTFHKRSEMVVNRPVLEELVSQTLEDFYNKEEKYKHFIEVNHLIETCKTLQTEEIRLNRLQRSLTRKVKDAKCVIKKLIDKKELHNSGVIRRSCPACRTKKVRSVGLQVCLVGHMYVTKPVYFQDLINEEFLKSLRLSTPAENKQISFCKLPKYPKSPEYPPHVSKPPAPLLQVRKRNGTGPLGIILTWSFACKVTENIEEYHLFVYPEKKSGNTSTDVWEKVGGHIQALPLPMVCKLSQVVEGQTYHFILRAIDSQKRLGNFSTPASISF